MSDSAAPSTTVTTRKTDDGQYEVYFANQADLNFPQWVHAKATTFLIFLTQAEAAVLSMERPPPERAYDPFVQQFRITLTHEDDATTTSTKQLWVEILVQRPERQSMVDRWKHIVRVAEQAANGGTTYADYTGTLIDRQAQRALD
jgi:hypothetical protein